MTGRARLNRLLPTLLILAVAAMPLIAPWSKIVLTIAIAKGLAVLGVVVLLRAGQVSFGHAMFFAASAYAAAFLGKTMAGGDLLLL
ncbi:MAG: branched-chain amino acid ABC transporter permease, partial [Geminicoccaceae bacterium]